MPISLERFNLSHSMVSNKYPKGIKLEDIAAKLKEEKAIPQIDLEKFGLWEYGTPNFNTYYPDVKAEDLAPKDDEFVYPTFRALSKVRVNKYGPINFNKKGVLEKAAKKLIGQTVYTNHDQVIGSEVGVVLEASYSDGFTQDGVEVPGGINVKLKIDGKSNPKIARGIMMEPPSVHSMSVTVEFEWEQSHPGLSSDEFYSKQGTFDEKGVLIERVVINIVNFHEISFVSHGADVFAQKIDEEGNLNNPKYADRALKYKMEANKYAEKHGYSFDWRSYQTELLSFSTIPSKTNEKEKTENLNVNTMNDLLKLIITMFAMDAASTEAQAIAKLNEVMPGLKNAQTQLTGLQAKFPEGSVLLSADDKVKLTAYEILKKFQDDTLAQLRSTAIKNYNLTVGGADKADAGVTKLISEGSYDAVSALSKQYELSVEEKFPATCQECSSTNVKRATSLAKETPEGGETNKPKSNADVMESLTMAGMGSSSLGIHGNQEQPK